MDKAVSNIICLARKWKGRGIYERGMVKNITVNHFYSFFNHNLKAPKMSPSVSLSKTVSHDNL